MTSSHGHGRRGGRRRPPPRSFFLFLSVFFAPVAMMPVQVILASPAAGGGAAPGAKVEGGAPEVAAEEQASKLAAGTEAETETEDAAVEYLYEGDPDTLPVREYHHPAVRKNVTVAETDGAGPPAKSKENATAALAAAAATTAADIKAGPSSANATAPAAAAEEEESPELDLPGGTVAIVEFYAHWCPHCRLYKKEYVKLAREISERSYGDVPIVFYAVECTANGDICGHYEIEGYPTVMGFPLPDEGEDDGGGEEERKKKKHHGEPVVLNDDPTLMTPEIIGHTLGFGVARAARSHVERFEDDGEQGELEATFEELAEAATGSILERLEYPNRTIREIYHDAESSFRFALRHQIFRGRKVGTPLPRERAAAFSEWIDLLHWSLPPEFGALGIVHDLRDEFHSVVQSRENLLVVLDRHRNDPSGYVGGGGGGNLSPSPRLPPAEKWTGACTHGGNPGSGYTCGLWELFHLVTVGVSQRYPDGFREGEDVGTLGAAEALRNYVSNFFACDVCRTNFVRHYDDCGADVCTRLSRNFPTPDGARELPLWLWETHNLVNVRLAKENAELLEWRNVTEAEREAARFPTRDMCPRCWRFDGSWDVDVLFGYLKATYWPGGDDSMNYSSSTRRRRLQTIDGDDERSMGSTKWAFILPLGLLLGITARGAIFRKRLERSGRHKKFEDCPRYATRDSSNLAV